MRILVSCDRYPGIPLDGLTLRIHHYAKYLSAHHELDLVCLGDDTAANPEIEAFFKRIHRFPQPRYSRPPNPFSRLVSGFAPSTLYPNSSEVQSQLRHAEHDGNYDLIWDAGCNMLLNLAPLRRSVPLLADQVDDAFLRMRRELKLAASFYARLWTLKQMLLTWIFSVQYLYNAGAVLFVSQADADSFKRLLPFSKSEVIENGVDEEYFYPVDTSVSAAASTEIVFEGSMSFGPNIDAAQYFVDAILPLVRKVIPRARFTIVGRDPTDAVKDLAGDGVEVTGSVPDIRPYLKNAGVFVCPMRSGAGIKNPAGVGHGQGRCIYHRGRG